MFKFFRSSAKLSDEDLDQIIKRVGLKISDEYEARVAQLDGQLTECQEQVRVLRTQLQVRDRLLQDLRKDLLGLADDISI